ncbi:hypothetical protein [Thiorhodovibrio frisius]|uniref:Uncharacterized protein n=1 Tax=Thiorhodovibrio frisius TaxID=631362 RepID=H8YW23_9GAMM|nr:hypothetical protein [Thiorhodovibrio frisius]EIC23814.1 hypothetical protein Thi970DRAFT_00326 [Thiorhodovibrio frisius]WPL23001.1 hypothetical protein Thiofri_03181 [Thiorhodovibrio frisius]
MTCRSDPADQRPIRFGATRRWACRELSLMAQRLRLRAKQVAPDGGQPERLTSLAQRLEQLAR